MQYASREGVQQLLGTPGAMAIKGNENPGNTGYPS